MPMITLEDMVTRFGEAEMAERSNHENPEELDVSVLQKAIDDAEAEVASYLQAAGVLGAVSASPPKALVIKTCDIARYYLYEEAVTQIIEDRYKSAIAWLKTVVANPQMLVAEADPAVVNPSRFAVMPNKPESWADMAKEVF